MPLVQGEIVIPLFGRPRIGVAEHLRGDRDRDAVVDQGSGVELAELVGMNRSPQALMPAARTNRWTCRGVTSNTLAVHPTPFPRM